MSVTANIETHPESSPDDADRYEASLRNLDNLLTSHGLGRPSV